MYHGKVIYQPAGKAAEYSQWAANFYNGCSARCEYCYNRHGRSAKVLGCDKPTLKKSLINERKAIEIFRNEIEENLPELREHGLFFNFVSDPCLPITYVLNFDAWVACYWRSIRVKILTKQVWWIDKFINVIYMNTGIREIKKTISIGLTLTGHDELEPGAATNMERIEAMKKLHNAGFKTWASIEPIIDFESSFEMIHKSVGFCDLYKIGLQSGVKQPKILVEEFIKMVITCLPDKKIYFKDSLLKAAGISREDLPANCVTRDFNL